MGIDRPGVTVYCGALTGFIRREEPLNAEVQRVAEFTRSSTELDGLLECPVLSRLFKLEFHEGKNDHTGFARPTRW